MGDDDSNQDPTWSVPSEEAPSDQIAPGSYTETTRVSWFGRIWSAIGGIFFGLILLIGGVVLLFWNEGRAVETAQSLKEGARAVVEARVDAIDPALEGKLVHVSGAIAVAAPPMDHDFDVSAPGARLLRKVEMYQWKETKSSQTEKKLGGAEETVTTYDYAKRWSETEIPSGGFRHPEHHNPPAPLHSASFPATLLLGAFELPADLVSGLGVQHPAPIDARQADQIGARLGRPARLLDGEVFIGRDPQNPQIGDLRVRYLSETLDEASVLAAQRQKAFAPFMTSNGEKLFLARAGKVGAADMFRSAESENAVLTWVLRIVGFVLLSIGFGLILRLFSVLADVIPLLGDIVGLGTAFVAMAFGAALSLLVIGFSWIYHRPLLGLALLAGGLLLFIGPILRARGAGKAVNATGGAR